jgi:hypothetical protein
MATLRSPIALRLLAHDPNVAADAALVEALSTLVPEVQHEVIDLLVRRAHSPSLTRLIGRSVTFDDSLNDQLARRAGDLAASLRMAIESENGDERLGAIGLIERGRATHLAYLLADALRSRCPRTRERAADALYNLTSHWLGVNAAISEGRPLSEEERGRTMHWLAEALRSGVSNWELHLQPKVLEAATWLADPLEETIVAKLNDPRCKLAHVLEGMLLSGPDPRKAGFAVRALAIPSLRSAAVVVIRRAQAPDSVRALVAQADLLKRPDVAGGALRIPDCEWLDPSVALFHEAGAGQAEKAVAWLGAIGCPKAAKTQRLWTLITGGSKEFQSAVLHQLVSDRSPEALGLLEGIASSHEEELAGRAREELRRRGRWADGSVPTALDRDDPALLMKLRAQLAAANSRERAHALQRIRECGLTRTLEERIYHLAYDPDALVRSRAISLLADLPGRTSERILRAALDDPDPRVQANAIDVLDALNVPSRREPTQAKLGSPNNRVRANAIKALLRTEVRQAGTALLEMLGHPSRDHRVSALWVVERLNLQSLGRRLRELSQLDPDPKVRARSLRVLQGWGWASRGQEAAEENVFSSLTPGKPAEARCHRSC